MRVPGKTLGWIAAGLVVAGALYGVFVYSSRPAKLPFAGDCRVLPASAGVGDIALDDKRGIAYLTYLDRVANEDGKRPTGTIMLVDLNMKEPRVRAALATDPPDFRPVALRLENGGDGARRLVVTDESDLLLTFEQSPTGAFTLLKSETVATADRKPATLHTAIAHGSLSLLGSQSKPYLQICQAGRQ